MANEQQKEQSRNPSIWYVISFAAAASMLAGAAVLASGGTATGWEYTWLSFINGWSDALYRPMFLATFLGSTAMAALTVVGLFFAKMYRLAWRLAITVVGAYGVAFLLKHFVGRERPAELYSTFHARVAESEMGFPSGHATLATVLVLTLWPYLSRPWRWVAVVLALIVMLSRLYLGVHLPLDIVGGVAVGTMAVCFLRLLPMVVRRWLRIS